MSGLAQVLLEKEDANVLVVDWLCRASYAYNQVVDNYKEVAVQISILINQLTVSLLHYFFKHFKDSGQTFISVCRRRCLKVLFCAADADRWC